MKNNLKLIALLCGGVVWAGLSLGQVEESEQVPLQAALERWSEGRPGAVVAGVIEGGQVSFVSAGSWGEDGSQRADADSLFEIGSITKVFTSILLADAVEKGKLNLDNTIGTPFDESMVTLQELATHTSGLPRLPVDIEFSDATDPYVALDAESLRESFALAVEDLDGGPHDWVYSNFAVSVLGQALADQAEMRYAELLKGLVFEPLGMESTVVSNAEIEELVPGFNAAGPAHSWHFQAYAPAGGIVSSARDMTKWIQAVMVSDSSSLGSAIKRTMEVQVDPAGPDKMGLGWLIREINGNTVYWHNGGTGGYRSFVGVDPVAERSIVILSARDKGVDGIGFAWMQGMEIEDTAGTNLDLEEFVGNYPLAPQFVLRVRVVKGTLAVQATGQSQLGLRATGEDVFGINGVEASLRFERGADGEIVAVILRQGGADQRAPRSSEPIDDSEPDIITLPENELMELVGRYPVAPAFALTVTREGNQLFAQGTGQPKFPVFATASDTFFFKVVEAQISFKRDDDGLVTGLVLHQGGQDVPAERE